MPSTHTDPASLITLPQELLYEIFGYLPTTTYDVVASPGLLGLPHSLEQTVPGEHELPDTQMSILHVSRALTPIAREVFLRNNSFLFKMWDVHFPGIPDKLLTQVTLVIPLLIHRDKISAKSQLRR